MSWSNLWLAIGTVCVTFLLAGFVAYLLGKLEEKL